MLERAGAPFRGFGDWLARVVDGFYRVLGRPGKWLQDFINGSWLGHPVHPVLTDVVIGGATLIVVFDLLGARPRCARASGPRAWLALVSSHWPPSALRAPG